jgi:hypothetical protein
MYTLDKVNYLGEDDCVSCAQSVIDKYGGVMYKLPLDYDPYDEDASEIPGGFGDRDPGLFDYQVAAEYWWAYRRV